MRGEVVGVWGGWVGVPVGVDSVVLLAVGWVSVVEEVCRLDGTAGEVLLV